MQLVAFNLSRGMFRAPTVGTVTFGSANYESDAGSPPQNPDLHEEDDHH